jgi:hypothetical protein
VLPPLRFPFPGCQSLGGGCRIDPTSGNLLLQASPPASDVLTLPPILYYNSNNAAMASEIGNGWSHFFKRSVVEGIAGPIHPPSPRAYSLVTGAGQVYTYVGVSTDLEPSSNAPSDLHSMAAIA